MTGPASPIDIHTHIMPPAWEDFARRFGIEGWPAVRRHTPCRSNIMLGDEEFRVVSDQCFSAVRRISDMDAEGIGRQLISPIPVLFCYWGSTEATAEFARVQNDYIAQVVADNPERFLGAGTVAMQSTRHAIAELERMKQLGFHAVEIGTNVNGRDLDDPTVVEILAAAESIGLSVFVHPWEPIGAARMRSYYLPHFVGLPAETSLAIARLIFAGVLDRLPKLRIGFAHGGGTFPALLGRIDHGHAVRPEAKRFIASSPSSYLNRLYFDSITHDPRGLELLCEKFGSRHVMLGSDYPFDMGVKHPLSQLEGANISKNECADVLFRAAEEFLGISQP